jgi:hypothetical protein
MADAYIQIPADSTGKKVRTNEVTVGADSVHQHAFTLYNPDGTAVDWGGSQTGNALGVYVLGEQVGVGWKTAKVETNPTTGEDGLLVNVMPYGDPLVTRLVDSTGTDIDVLTSNPVLGNRGLVVYNVPSGTQTVTGSITASQSAIGNAMYGAVTATVSSAVKILNSDNARKQFIITNNGTGNLYVGLDSGVTTTSSSMGLLISPGGSFSHGGNDGYWSGDVYGIYSQTETVANVSYWALGFSA